MARVGTYYENKFVDVSAGFLEQAKREGCSREFQAAWIRIFCRKFPRRTVRRLTPAETARARQRQAAGFPDNHGDPAWLFIKQLLKDMKWQTYAWHKITPHMHWREWCALEPGERDRVSNEIFEDFHDYQRDCVLKSLDELFGIPGSSKELAIVIDD